MSSEVELSSALEERQRKQSNRVILNVNLS